MAGLAEWARGQGRVASLAGGVAPENVASRRVLEKNGFHLVEDANEGDEELFRLRIR